MSKYKYLILGTGVGKAIAWWLLKQDDTEQVVCVDLSLDEAERAIGSLPLSRIERSKVVPLEMDISQKQSRLLPFFRNYDVVISAIPAVLNPPLARACIEAKTHFCDLGGVVPVTQEMLKDNKSAVDAEASVITDNGIMPGLGNIMAIELAERWEEATESITITSGGIPLYPKREHFNYQQIYSAAGTRHIAYDPVPELEYGKIVEYKPLDTFITVSAPTTLEKLVPELQHVELFASSGAALAPWLLQERGIQRFREWTLRWPGFEKLLRDTPEEKFEEVFAELPKLGPDNPDIMYMQVKAESEYGQYSAYELVETFDQASGLAAIERTTAFPAALMARWQAGGYIKPGVRTADLSFQNERDRKLYLFQLKHWLNWTYESE